MSLYCHYKPIGLSLAEEFDTNLPMATSVRKAIATRGGALEGQRFTDEQTMITFLNKALISIFPGLDTFLSMHREKFPERQRGNIYSEVRNIIGRSRN